MTTRLHLVSALALVAFAAGCNTASSDPGPDAAVQTLDPTGNWSLVYEFGASCGNAATNTTGTFTVTYGPMGYQMLVAGVQSMGVLACTTDSCTLSGTWAWATSDTEFQQSMNLTLDDHFAIQGEGTEAVVTADSNCTYPFTVAGSRM